MGGGPWRRAKRGIGCCGGMTVEHVFAHVGAADGGVPRQVTVQRLSRSQTLRLRPGTQSSRGVQFRGLDPDADPPPGRLRLT